MPSPCHPRLLCLLALWATALPVAAQETAESPNLDEKAETLTFGGLVQTQFNTTSADGVDVTDLALRRVRLSANAQLNDLVSGRIQAELANATVGGSAELNEAYALFTFAAPLQVLVGKGGRPFGIVDATTAATLIPIERGARFRGVRTVDQYRIMEELAYAGRSVGVQVLGEVGALPFGVTYAAGYFTGALGEEGGDADIRQLAARLELAPAAWLTVGLAATSRAFVRADPVGMGEGSETFGSASGADASGETRRGGGYAVDLEVGSYGEPGPHLLGELVTGTINPFRAGRFTSAQAWAAWRFGRLGAPTRGILLAAEPLFRASWGDAEGPLDAFDGVLLTPGLNLYAAPEHPPRPQPRPLPARGRWRHPRELQGPGPDRVLSRALK